MSQTVEISDGNACPLDQADFLTKYTNKLSFVNSLVYKLELHGFKAVVCPSDALTTIVKRSLHVQDNQYFLPTFASHKDYADSKQKR